MKGLLLLVLVTLALAKGAMGRTIEPWINGISVSTNVDGMVLTLEFNDVRVVAGERLEGRMIVSNASLVPRHIHWGTGVRDGDTKIGQFIVQNDEGEPVTRTAWQPAIQHWLGGSEWDDLEPGDAVAFDGDIVKNYSLTNRGIYLVKAVATVGRRGKHEASVNPTFPPIVKPLEGAEEMIVETPFVSITVLPRPSDMPPPYALHKPHEIENMLKDRTPLFVMTATHPKPQRPPSVPRIAPHEELPPKGQAVAVQPKNTFGAATDQPGPTTRTRDVLYVMAVLVLVGGLGIYLWSRRKHENP